MKKTIYKIYLTLAVLLTLVLNSCAKDEPKQDDVPEGTVVTATFAIQQKAFVGTPTNPADDAEKITSWWVAFVDVNRKVAAVVSRPADRTAAVEAEDFDADIATGTYTLYSFANLTPAEVKEMSGLEFVVGNTVGSASELLAAACEMPNDIDPTAAPYHGIPMSGVQQVRIVGRRTQPYDVEVVRMVAKFEVTFANECAYPFTVKAVTLSKAHEGKIPMLPDFSTLGGEPTILPQATTVDLTHTLAAPLTIAAGDKSASKKTIFYLRETKAVSPREHFTLALTVERNGAEEEMLYSLMEDESFEYINRNDYIRVPVLLTDVIFRPEVWFYPPIGGYPEAEIEEREDGDTYVTFQAGGDFVVRPMIRLASETPVMWYSITDTRRVLSYSIEVEDTNNILDKADALKTLSDSGEILGTLTGAQGVAKVVLNARIKISESLVHDYHRNIYLIVK